ncbi:CCA tRNA nucleotidyltransferase [Deinococcus radiomollis]|uniref:CCA tRNA nucleotidyltransferase n=1 Tax=Deinococcus radiomollis TaxID=468916 RepID=UPI0038923FE9
MTLPAPLDPTPPELWNGLPETARTLLTTLRRLAPPGARLALVGGAVRDLLLGQGSASPDLDIVLEGGNVQALAQQVGAAFSFHAVYGNATLHLPGGLYADLVSARRESYPVAGGPPAPRPGSLEDDLARRDFTVNAAALELLGEGTCRLLSLSHLPEDLQARKLRPLHARSFHEDASRLVRGARLAARLELHAHAELLAQVPAALQIAAQTPRLASELRLLLEEPLPGRAARVLEDWGASGLLPAGAANLLERLDAVLEQAALGQNSRTLYAAALLSLSDRADDLNALGLGQRPAELLARARNAQVWAAGSPEATLQALLGLTLPYTPLQGRDLLGLGLKAGPEVGRTLTWLAAGRKAGRYASAEDERRAVLEYLHRPERSPESECSAP